MPWYSGRRRAACDGGFAVTPLDPTRELPPASHARGEGFGRRSIVLYAGLLGGLLLTIPTTILVARGLGPADKGVWSLVVQLLFLSEIFSTLGGGAYYVIQLGHGRDYDTALSTAVAQGLAQGLLAAGITTAVVLAFAPSSIATVILVPVVCAAPLLVVSRLLNYVSIGIDRSRIFTAATLSQATVQLLTVGIASITHHLTLSVALWSFTVGVAARLVVPLGLLLAWRVPKLRVDMALALGSLSFGWRRVISELEDATNTRLPLFLLPLFRSLIVVGVYSIALGLSEVMGQAGIAASTAALGNFAQNSGGTRSHSLIRMAVGLSVVIALSALLATPAIGVVFGEPYRGAEWEFVILLPTVPVLTFNRMCVAALSAQGTMSLVATGGTLSLLGIFLLALPLEAILGANGASLALLGGLLVQSVLFLRFLTRNGGASSRELLIVTRDDVQYLCRRWLTRRGTDIGTEN